MNVEKLIDDLRNTGSITRDSTADIKGELQNVHGVVRGMLDSWKGKSSTIFEGEWEELKHEIEAITEAMEELSAKCEQEADELEKVISS
jgi:WXG100 family type VII secretion target